MAATVRPFVPTSVQLRQQRGLVASAMLLISQLRSVGPAPQPGTTRQVERHGPRQGQQTPSQGSLGSLQGLGRTKGNSVALRGAACGDFCSQWAAERADSSDGEEEAQTPKAAASELAGGGLRLGLLPQSKGFERLSAPSRGGSSPRWLWQGRGCCCKSPGRRGLSWLGVTFPAQWLPLCPGVRREQVLPGHPQSTIRNWLTLNLPGAGDVGAPVASGCRGCTAWRGSRREQ